MSKQLFIGIDGGASFCRARIRDMQGNLLGEGWGGPANIYLDLALAVRSIRAASEAAGRSAGLDEQIYTAPMSDWAWLAPGLKAHAMGCGQN